jgi:hypothetical protein
MMKKLIRYEVATKFSWLGQKGKEKFCTFEFPNVIFRKLVQLQLYIYFRAREYGFTNGIAVPNVF